MKIATGSVALSSQRDYYKKVAVQTETTRRNDTTGAVSASVNYMSTETRENGFGLQFTDGNGNSK